MSLFSGQSQMGGGGQPGGVGQRMFSNVGAFIIAVYIAPVLFHLTNGFAQSYVEA